MLCAAVLLCGPARLGVAADETPEVLENRVKAAFLYKFAGYVEWPETSFARPDAPFAIGVMGADAIAAELTGAVAGRKLNERNIAIRRLKPGEPVSGVQILFVGRSEGARLNQLLQATQPRPILTVTESEGALAQGSVINFIVAERRVRFEISLDSAEKRGLRLSSRLLAVAQQVRTGTP